MQWEGNPNVQGAGQIRPAYRTYLERFRPGWDWTANDPARNKIAVLIDNRADDPLLPHIIGNFSHFLWDDAWNFDWIVPPSSFGPRELNAFLLSADFWEQFHEEHILLFQRDTVCLQPLDPKFLDYDFIGAPCGMVLGAQDGEAPHFFDMNGGLSLRRRSAMLKALEHTPVPDGMPEDVFFSRVLRKMARTLDARVPDFGTALKFSLESIPLRTTGGGGMYLLPFGVHGTDKHYHEDYVAEDLLAQAKVPEVAA